MRSNIEQAVSSILDSNQEIHISTVLSAYLRIAGFAFPTPEAVVAFERAMDKHPDMKERPGTPCTKAITDIRQDYLMQVLKVAVLPGPGPGGLYACPCCGIQVSADEVRRVLALENGLEPDGKLEHIAALEKLKKRKTKRSVTTKTKVRARKARAFDPYGPSTSASSI